MHFHYKVATTLSLLVLISFAFQLISLLSVPITSSITLCTYDGYKFGVFGLCSTSTNKCSSIEIGYSKTTVEELEGFSLPSNARHSISSLLIVHAISTGLTFILLVMCILTHRKYFNRSLKFLFCLILLCFISFWVCLLSFLVDILLFIPHLDWGGWIILASAVLLAIAGTMLCIMRRTASSRNAYDLRKKQDKFNNNEVEMYSMLPLKETYGYVKDDTGSNSPRNEDYDDNNNTHGMDDDNVDKDDSVNEADLTNQGLLYNADAMTQPTDFMRNQGSLHYRGYNNAETQEPVVYASSNILQDNNISLQGDEINSHNQNIDEEDDYYSCNPMTSSTEMYTRNPRNSMTSSRYNRNSIINTQQPGVAPYPTEDPGDIVVAPSQQTAPYPEEDFIDGDTRTLDAGGEDQTVTISTPEPNRNSTILPNSEPTLPRVSTPPMEDEYVPQPIKMSPLKGPRPIPGSQQHQLENYPEEDNTKKLAVEHEDEFTFANVPKFKKPANNQTQTTLTNFTSSTAAHKNFNNQVGQNHSRFVSNMSSSVAASSYYGSETQTSVVVDESDQSSSSSMPNEEIPTSEYLDYNEENLSTYGSAAVGKKFLKKQPSMDSIASSNFTSISQRPINPKYYEADSKKGGSGPASRKPPMQSPAQIQGQQQHPLRARVTTAAAAKKREERLKQTRDKLIKGEL